MKDMLYNFDDLLFHILTIDRFFHKEGVFNVKARPYAALSFRDSGTGTFRINNKSFYTKPGDVLFIPADTPFEVDYSTSESIVVNMEFCNYTEPEVFKFKPESGVSVLFSLMLEDWQKRHSVNHAKATIYNIFYNYVSNIFLVVTTDHNIFFRHHKSATCKYYIF